MDKTLRSILWVLVTLVVISSFSAGWFFVAKEKLFNEYSSLEDLFEASVARLNSELASSNKENTELKTKLAAVEKEFKGLSARNEDLEARYTKILRERDDFDKELARVKKGKFYIEKKLKEMESDDFLTGVLKEKIALEVELSRLKDSIEPKYAEIEKLKAENMDLEVMFSRLNEEKTDLRQKFRDSDKVAEILSRDLLREKDKSEQHKKEVEKVRAEMDLLRAKFAEVKDVSDTVRKLLAAKEDMQSKLSSLERDVEYKEREIDKLKIALNEQAGKTGELRAEAYHSPAEVDLPPIVLHREGRGSTAVRPGSLERITERSDFRGRVITVNRDHNFVVVDLGKQDGIQTGDVFNVYRRDLLVGVIQVIQTRDRISAADIKEAKEGFIIEIEDAIIKR
jgi:chromosome segregation ATPase